MSESDIFGEKAKQFFSFDIKYCFVNHGSYGAVPRKICRRQISYLEEMNNNPDVWFRCKSISLWMKARDAIAEFVGADPENLVFVQNTTTGINTTLKAYSFGHGDAILITNNTHVAVRKVCAKITSHIKGGELVVIQIPFPSVSEDSIVRLYEETLRSHPNIKLAVIDHITCPTALVLPVKKLARLCRQFGVLTVVDGAHAPGNISLYIEDLDVDVYSGNLHKWMFTPRGCAILWIRKEHQDWCAPLVTSINHGKGLLMEYFMQGTRDDIPYFLVPDAIQFYEELGGYEQISSYTTELLERASRSLSASFNTEKISIPKTMESKFMRMVKLPDVPGYKSTWKSTSKNPPNTQRFAVPLFNQNDDCRRLISDIANRFFLVCTVFPVNDDKYLRLSANVYNTDKDFKRVKEVFLRLIDGKWAPNRI